ncbi:MAG: hypothetical protein WCE21_01710 [Candidatus Babeliales bacterium]
MKKRIFILVISYMAAFYITHNNQLIASEHKKDLITKGLEQLSTAFTASNGHIEEEINNRHLKNAIETLTKAAQKDNKKTTEQVAGFLKNNETMQLLVAYGFVDKLLQKILLQPQDLAIEPFVVSHCAVEPQQYDSKLKLATAKPFEYLLINDPSQETDTLTCTTEDETYTYSYRIAPNYTNLTRVTEDKKTHKEEVLNLPLTPHTFLSIIIGNTKIIFVSSRDKQTYTVDIKPLTLDKNIISFTKQYKDTKEIINLQLSPNERFLLIQGNNRKNYSSVINDLSTGAKAYQLVSTKLKWSKEDTDAILPKSHWSADGKAIVSSPYLWLLDTVTTSPTTQLKLALYHHAFTKIKESDLTKLSTQELHKLRRTLLIPLPSDIPKRIREEIIKTRKEFIDAAKLQMLLK